MTKAAPLLALLAAACLAAPAAGSPLSPYKDRYRVLVLAGEAGDPRLSAERDAIKAEAAALEERDVKVIEILGAEARDGEGRPLGDADAVRRAADLPPSGFGVALIGKDGGVKLHQTRPAPLKEVLALIDAMPMRIQEMRSRRP